MVLWSRIFIQRLRICARIQIEYRLENLVVLSANCVIGTWRVFQFMDLTPILPANNTFFSVCIQMAEIWSWFSPMSSSTLSRNPDSTWFAIVGWLIYLFAWLMIAVIAAWQVFSQVDYNFSQVRLFVKCNFVGVGR